MKIVNIIGEASHHTILTVFYVFGKCENIFIFSIIYRNSKQHRQLICYLMKYRGKIILHSQYHRWWWYQWPWCWSSSPRVYMYWFDGSNVLNADGRYVSYGGESQSLGTDVWCACLIFCLPSYSCIIWSYPSLRCACGGRAERPQMVYMNDNTSLIHQIEFRHNLNPCAHPRWFVEWFSTLWSIKLWPSIPK